MGVINVTPDSFSDGGKHSSVELALQNALALYEEGADIIDIGAESTRPNSKPVSLEEEWKRLEPLLCLLAKHHPQIPISIDSYKDEIIKRSFDYNIAYINNVKGLLKDDTLKKISQKNIKYIAMHMHKSPKNMQDEPLCSENALDKVTKFYDDTVLKLQDLGFQKDHILLDPGIGFGKDDSANLKLLKNCHYHPLKQQFVVGISRKSFFGRLLGIKNPLDRDPVSKMLELSLMMAGVYAIRTHEVGSLKNLKNLLNKK